MRYTGCMKAPLRLDNPLVAACVAVFLLSAPIGGWAQSVDVPGSVLEGENVRLDALFAELQNPDLADPERVVSEIWILWSKSGSPAMDLLLGRGQSAMAAGAPELAIDHFTALIDHAPEFAEGWNARATAYFQIGDLGPSVNDIAHVLQLNPRHFGALSGLGMIFEQLGRPEKALEVYRAALAINPHMADVLDAVKRLETATAGQDL
jgi:tetratricopeptide (TPR) repeat protein